MPADAFRAFMDFGQRLRPAFANLMESNPVFEADGKINFAICAKIHFHNSPPACKLTS
jgi:hypothetical protein